MNVPTNTEYRNAVYDPETWRRLARELVDAAESMEGKLEDFWEGVRRREWNDPQVAVYFMLCAYALENLIKAKLVEKEIATNGILHIASPVPVEQPRNSDEIVTVAKEGTINVLSAARNEGVQRVVLTSSVSAIAAGNTLREHTYTHEDWSNLDSPLTAPYEISKTMAEKAAWELVADKGGPELAVVNPALVLGPALEPDFGSSLEAIVRLMRGNYPLVPRLGFSMVDVRDVAALHRLCYERAEAPGNRYICSNGFRWLVDITRHLREEFPEYKKKLPHREAPNLLVRALAVFDKAIADHVRDLGKVKRFDTTPARALGWEPRSPEQAASAAARSLIDLGIV